MARNRDLAKLVKEGNTWVVEWRWSVSRARDSYGYNVCNAYVDGVKVGGCNGGGYDMKGAALAPWLETQVRLTDEFYGLSWHDPNWRVPEKVAKREEAGESLGLERYQAYFAASNKVRTEKHVVPQIDGACGLSSLLRALGFREEWLSS